VSFYTTVGVWVLLLKDFRWVDRAGGLMRRSGVVLHDFAQVRYSASVVTVEYLRAVDSGQVASN
jgi:hypothetical protein